MIMLKLIWQPREKVALSKPCDKSQMKSNIWCGKKGEEGFYFILFFKEKGHSQLSGRGWEFSAQGQGRELSFTQAWRGLVS